MMDICTGTCRPVADDSLTNESRVDSLEFDDGVSDFYTFRDFAKSSAVFWANTVHSGS